MGASGAYGIEPGPPPPFLCGHDVTRVGHTLSFVNGYGCGQCVREYLSKARYQSPVTPDGRSAPALPLSSAT